MLATRGRVFPISASLQRPEEDRPLRRVLLWDTQGDLYSTFEVDAVEALFGAVGIECVRTGGRDRTVDEFLAAYSDATYDAIWIAGHGEIDHWQDGSSKLVIGDHDTVGTDELLTRTPLHARRRLLVLNVCDGGVSAVNGDMHRLGTLSRECNNARQAAISHFWPVAPLVAGAFGVFVAAGLARGLSYFASFTAGLQGIRMPLSDITRAVREIVPDQQFVQRLENADLPTTNIIHWGSPCFFE